MENNKNPHYELKLEHQLKHQPEAKDFNIDFNGKIFRQASSDPLEEIFFSSTVDDFIWEDEDCPEKVALYELLVDVGIIEFEAQFLLNDIILYVSKKVQLIEDGYKGVFTLMVEVRLPPEPVVISHAGSVLTQSQVPVATIEEQVKLYNAGLEQNSMPITKDEIAT